MAGVKINNYGSGNNNLDNLMVSTDTQRRGYHAVSLTEWTNTTTIPKIAKGSVIEIGGTIVEFQADETITGSIATGNNYISINSSTYVATWTTTIPVWNDEYQGFYSGTNRILNFRVNKNISVYTKYDIALKNSNLSIGNSLSVGGNFSVGGVVEVNTIRNVQEALFSALAGSTRGQVYSSFSFLPEGVACGCSGDVLVGSTYFQIYAIKKESSSIYVYYFLSPFTSGTDVSSRLGISGSSETIDTVNASALTTDAAIIVM